MLNVFSKILRKVDTYLGVWKASLNYIKSRDMCCMGADVKLIGNAAIRNFNGKKEDIIIGDGVVLLGEVCTFNAGAKISIGNRTYIGPGSMIRSCEEIVIGSRVQISYNVNIYDNNSHSISAESRYKHAAGIISGGHPIAVEGMVCSPVYIGDDAWIGFSVIIMKGVRIGKCAIIGSGSVITKDVPDFAIVVGNPQRTVGWAKP